ncbi:uncharacterized protein LOC120339512 [Styela clava]|uniref:uncharacterized protein LOC120339512 n=1 Tax=Styela clava TaxID=7725 RepID=UPI00193A4710|nr:uncharacterized protein LOC120339512 [Styela clava]
MKGRKGRGGGKGKNRRSDRSESREEKGRSGSRTPQPRTKRRRDSPSYSDSDESETISVDDVDNIPDLEADTSKEENVNDSYSAWDTSCGVKCRRHPDQFHGRPVTNFRSLYSHFPKDQQRLLVFHIICTLFVYLIIFPLVNCVWTYFKDTDAEIINLFAYITDYPRTSFTAHIRHLSWLSLPGISAETISLLLAVVLKDLFILNWENITENLSVTDVIVGRVARRYRR